MNENLLSPRHDWTLEQARELYEQALPELIFQSQGIHREFHDPCEVQVCSLLSIKTGACPEDCAYCPQSARYQTDVSADKLLTAETIFAEAQRAKDGGASRFCMGAAWRSPKDRDIDELVEVIGSVKHLGLETCMTLGMLSLEQAERLAKAGLDYYNHNVDTSPEFYREIITTRNLSLIHI